jgi:hypothetical protein
MLFQQLNRSDSDKVYISVKNVEGATITAARAVSLVNTSTDGVNAVIADAAADFPGFVGFAKADIANNDYGLVQIFGFVDSILLSAEGTSITINAGDPIVPVATGATSAAPSYAASGFKFALASNTPVAVSAAGYCSGLITLL